MQALISGPLPAPSDFGPPEPFEALWAGLDGEDAAAAESAAWALAGRPGPATALLAERLRPAIPAAPFRVAALIADSQPAVRGSRAGHRRAGVPGGEGRARPEGRASRPADPEVRSGSSAPWASRAPRSRRPSSCGPVGRSASSRGSAPMRRGECSRSWSGSPADAGGRAGAGRGTALAIAVRRPSEATKAIGIVGDLDARAEADEFPADARPHVEAESSHDGSPG